MKITLAARQAQREHYRVEAIRRADTLGRSLTCSEKPVERHGTCAGLDATGAGGLGCLCECHDADVSS